MKAAVSARHPYGRPVSYRPPVQAAVRRQPRSEAEGERSSNGAAPSAWCRFFTSQRKWIPS